MSNSKYTVRCALCFLTGNKVSKQFFRAAMDPQWWEARCRRDLALSSLPEGTISWTEAYKQRK